jgi:chromosome segregation ATPase
MTGTTQLLAAQATLAVEHVENLRGELKAAVAEGKRIDEQLKATGERLVAARTKSESLLNAREGLSRTRDELDAAFEANDFPTPDEETTYEQRREQLTQQWHRLTAEILPFSNVVGRSEDEFRTLQVVRGRVAGRAADLREAIKEIERRKRF